MNWHYKHRNLKSFSSSINLSLQDVIRNLKFYLIKNIIIIIKIKRWKIKVLKVLLFIS